MASTRRARSLLAAGLAVACFVVLNAALPLFARSADPQQKPGAVFRTQVNVVQVDAVVVDSQGHFVPDLRQEEFEVLEDGKPQRLASTLVVNIPVERVEAPLFAGSKTIKPDVESNARPFEGRLYLIVLDDLHVSALRTNIARRVAREFIEKNVAPNDIAAVVTTSGNARRSQDFTSDRKLLLAAVGQFVGQKMVSPGIASLSQAGTPEALSADAAAPERRANAMSALGTLAALATYLGRVRDLRKALVYISEGVDYDFGALPEINAKPTTDGQPLGFVHQQNASREIRERLRDFLDAANRGNVTLYSFDPRAYTHGGDEFVDIASGQPDDLSVEEQNNVRSIKPMDDFVASQDNLRTMATETGGFAVTGSPMAIQKAFGRVRTETSNYYIIGYYPSNEARDGKFRRIVVRVKRPGVRVEARRGYTAPKGNAAPPPPVDAKEGTSPALRDALGSPLPLTGFTLRAAAAPFRGTPPNASVLVIVQARGSDLTFVPRGDRFDGSVELSAVAIDRAGKTRAGERTTLDMPLTARTHETVAQMGLVFQMRLNVPPGQYQLRIAGRDTASERVGMVLYDLEVPDFGASPLSMSGLVLTAADAGQIPSPRPDEDMKKLLPGTPITARSFSANDELTLLAEVYDNKANQPHGVSIATTVLADDGRAMFTQKDERTTGELAGGRGGFGYTAKIPLRGFGAGIYVVKVEARSTLDPDVVVTREIQISVR